VIYALAAIVLSLNFLGCQYWLKHAKIKVQMRQFVENMMKDFRLIPTNVSFFASSRIAHAS